MRLRRMLAKVSLNGVETVLQAYDEKRFYDAWKCWRDILRLYPISCFPPREWKKLRTITLSLGRLAVDELVKKGGYPDENR